MTAKLAEWVNHLTQVIHRMPAPWCGDGRHRSKHALVAVREVGIGVKLAVTFTHDVRANPNDPGYGFFQFSSQIRHFEPHSLPMEGMTQWVSQE